MTQVRTIGRYQLVRHLATGGMGRVYLARAPGIAGFERHVLIKTLEIKGDHDFITMFLDEARVLGRLHHHHIASIFEIVREPDNSHFLVMDYVHGHNALGVWDRSLDLNAGLPMDFALTVVAAAASALHYAHTRTDRTGKPLDIVHRDVSLANLMIGFDGAVKLIDFGIAKAVDRSTATQTGYVKGKLGYMAPEQVNGGVADKRTDIYALGLVLYELTTMTRPFRAANELELLLKIRNADIRLPSDVVPSFPRGLELIIMKALRPNPDARFQDADTMRREIESFAHRNKLVMGDSAIAEVMGQLFENVEPWIAAPEAIAKPIPDDIPSGSTLRIDDPPPTIVRQLRAATELADQMEIEVHAAPIATDDSPTTRHESQADILAAVTQEAPDDHSDVVTMIVAGGAAPPPIPKRRTNPGPTVPEPIRRRSAAAVAQNRPSSDGAVIAPPSSNRPTSDGAVVIAPASRPSSDGILVAPPRGGVVVQATWPAESGVVVAAPRRKLAQHWRGAAISAATIAIAGLVALVVDLASSEPAAKPPVAEAAVLPAPVIAARPAPPPPTHTQPAPAQPAPAPAPEPAKATEVTIKITTSPADATVLLDGQRLGHTPFDGTVPAAPGSHKLKIRRRGYTTLSLDVDLSANVERDVTLQPAASD